MPSTGEQSTRRFTVTIDDEEFVVRGVGTQEYVAKLAKMVDERIEEVRRSLPNVPRHRVITLVAFNLAHELQVLKTENEELLEVLEEAR